MAYYKDAPNHRTTKRNYANEGSWDDEGAHYSAGSRRFGPSKDGEGRTVRAEQPYRARPQGDKPRGGFHSDRPQNGPRPERGDRPQRGFRNDARDERPRRDFRHLAPASREERPAPSYRDFEHRAPVAPVAPVVEENLPAENLLAGRNPIREALKSGRDIEKLLVQKGELSGSAREIVQMAKERHVVVQEVDKIRLDAIAPHHQGMLAYASAFSYSTVQAMLDEAAEKNEDPFLILLDGVTDPHNLGAIIRSAECAGAHGVIVTERRSVGLTPAAVKASAGAVEHCKVARVTNLNRTIEELRKANVWSYAMTMEGKNYEKVDFRGGVALVIGSEGEGISRLTRETCDMEVSLPLRGEIDSLNASVAAGIVMYRVLSCRSAK